MVCGRLAKPPSRLPGTHVPLQWPPRMVQEKILTSSALPLETRNMVHYVRVPKENGNSSSGRVMSPLICFLLPATLTKCRVVAITQGVSLDISWKVRNGRTGFWKRKAKLGCGDWMTFYRSREMMIPVQGLGRGWRREGFRLTIRMGHSEVLPQAFHGVCFHFLGFL